MGSLTRRAERRLRIVLYTGLALLNAYWALTDDTPWKVLWAFFSILFAWYVYRLIFWEVK
jgi:hypothetical protein